MAADRLILGENASFTTDSRETGINNNVIVCGSSGCGKTMSILEPRLLETYNGSCIVPVTKRRLPDKYEKTFEERGYIVHKLNFVEPEKSTVGFDLMKYIKSQEDIQDMVHCIVHANPLKDQSNADPYWDETAELLLSAYIGYVQMMKPNPNFSEVLKLHEAMRIKPEGDRISTSLDGAFDRLEMLYPNSFAHSCWTAFRCLPNKTASCVFGTLHTAIDKMFPPSIRALMEREDCVDFADLATRKTILFIATSAVNPALHTFINIFYGQAFKCLFEFAETLPSGRLPLQVNVHCDDFATGGKIADFPEYISIFREKGIAVSLLIQSESQLESMYGPTDATTIINNCDTYVYMGGMDLKTGYAISQRLNVPLDEVLYMPIGQEFIFRRGIRPIVTQRYNILDNPLYRQITEEFEREENSHVR